MSNLTIASLHQDFGETRILHDIDLNVIDGEFVALVSLSGCGTSPLLRRIAGVGCAHSYRGYRKRPEVPGGPRKAMKSRR